MKITQIKTIEQLLALNKEGKLLGLFQMPDDLYFHPLCPGISRSMLKTFRDWGEVQRTKATDDGNLFDSMITDPAGFLDKYAIGLEVNRNANLWKDFVKENPGKRPYQDHRK